jgi:hypothetical protein
MSFSLSLLRLGSFGLLLALNFTVGSGKANESINTKPKIHRLMANKNRNEKRGSKHQTSPWRRVLKAARKVRSEVTSHRTPLAEKIGRELVALEGGQTARQFFLWLQL